MKSSNRTNVFATLAVVLGLSLTVAWTFEQWTSRNSAPLGSSRAEIWSLETPSHARAQSFVRIQDTSYWFLRSAALITSNSHVATQMAPAMLVDSRDGTKLVLAADSIVQLGSGQFKLLKGLALVTRKGQDPKLLLNGTEVASLEPKLGSIHDLQHSGRVNFSWPKALASNRSFLEFSRDSSFRQILFTQPATGQAYLSIDFSDRSPGAWFARLRDEDKVLAYTAFSLVESQIPDVVRRVGRRWLTWRDRGLATLYRVEFSESESFAKVSQSFQVQNRELDLTLVKPGSHFVRITAISLTNIEYAGRPVAIQVQDKAEILQARVEQGDEDLKLFARGWKILLTHDEVSRIREGYVILHESELRGVRVSDELKATLGKSEKSSIVFELSRDEMFSNPERVRPTAQGELLPPALPLGILYARLRRIEADGSISAFGPTSRLTTWLPAPVPQKTRAFKYNDTNAVELSWDLNTTVAGYEVRLSRTHDFEPTATEVIRTRESSRKISTASLANFYWTVTAINDLGQPISITSPIQEVTEPRAEPVQRRVSRIPAMKRDPAMIEPSVPTPLFPAEDAVIVGGATATKYGKLKWDFAGRRGGEIFDVQLATDGDFVNIIEKKKTSKQEFTLQGDLPEGALFWRVRNAKTGAEWSRSRKFELVYE